MAYFNPLEQIGFDELEMAFLERVFKNRIPAEEWGTKDNLISLLLILDRINTNISHKLKLEDKLYLEIVKPITNVVFSQANLEKVAPTIHQEYLTALFGHLLVLTIKLPEDMKVGRATFFATKLKALTKYRPDLDVYLQQVINKLNGHINRKALVHLIFNRYTLFIIFIAGMILYGWWDSTSNYDKYAAFRDPPKPSPPPTTYYTPPAQIKPTTITEPLGYEKKKINPIVATKPKQKSPVSQTNKSPRFKYPISTPNSLYYDKQLKNGTSPLDACFGKGVYQKTNSWLTFKNDNSSDAIICLVDVYSKKVIRNEYVQKRKDFKMTKLPNGTYFLKVMYGNGWNPNKLNICGTKGNFERDIRFSISDGAKDFIRVTDDGSMYSTGEITLYTVFDGNMGSDPSTPEEFFMNK